VRFWVKLRRRYCAKRQVSGYTGISKKWNVTLRIVLDTCVLVSAARSRNGASFQLVSQLPQRKFQFALTVALYTEWQEVLTRPEHLPPGATPEAALAFLRYLVSLAHLQEVHFLWRPFLRDPDDDMVLECAVAAGSEVIVTHNLKDFKRAISLNVRAVTPAQFLAERRSKS
jgi:putative PIN family toxin of toxin-antitoxin system